MVEIKGGKLIIDIPEDEAGKAFLDAVSRILKLQLSRNLVYKDNWYVRNRIVYHTDRIDSKAGRIKQAEDLFFLGKISLQELETILLEEADDIAVYALFLLVRVNKLRDDINRNLPPGMPSDIATYLMGGVK